MVERSSSIEDEMSLGEERCSRSVLVNGLPSTIETDAVYIHFQTRKHGGGDVEEVMILQDGSAVVIFEKAQDASAVLRKTQELHGVRLDVKPYHQPSLKKSSRVVFSKVTAEINWDTVKYYPEDIRAFLDKVTADSMASWHETSYGFLLTGSYEQITSSRRCLLDLLAATEDRRSKSETTPTRTHAQNGIGVSEGETLTDTASNKSSAFWTEKTAKQQEKTVDVDWTTASKNSVKETGQTDKDRLSDEPLVRESQRPAKKGKTVPKEGSTQEHEENLRPKDLDVPSLKIWEAFKRAYEMNLTDIQKEMDVKIDLSESGSKVIIKPCSDDFKEAEFKRAVDRFTDLYQKALKTMTSVRFSASEPHDANRLRELVLSSVEKNPVLVEKAPDRKTWEMSGEEQTIGKVLAQLQREVKVHIKTCAVQTGGRSLKEEEAYSDDDTNDEDECEDSDDDSDDDDDDVDDCDVESHNYKLEHTIGKVKISVYQGDITDERADAIVNAANVDLVHGGGVAGAIIDKGGWLIQEESFRLIKRYGRLKVGDAIITHSGKLSCKAVIHTVGPEWRYCRGDQASNLLRQACWETFLTAERNRLRSVAFPAISSGIYGMPKAVCAQVMFSAAEEYSDKRGSNSNAVTDIRFVNNDDPTVKVFKKEFLKRYGEGKCESDERAVLENTSVDESRPNDTAANLGSRSTAEAASHSVGKPSEQKKQYTKPASKRGPEKNSSVALKSSGRTPSGVENQSGKGSQLANGARKKEILQSTGGEKYADQHIKGKKYRQKVQQVKVSYSAVVQSNPDNKQRSSDSFHAQKNPREFRNMPSAKGDQSRPECPICFGHINKPTTLPKCKHTFCEDCLGKALHVSPVCPVCRDPQDSVRSRGTQPEGTMMHRTKPFNLQGYEKYETIVIQYSFSDGVQSPHQPNPGQPYSGTARTAYLPDNREGRELLRLMKKAFNASLVFNIGQSVTSGEDNQIVWNIYHKTSMSGGIPNFGYPDPYYLQNVKQQLFELGFY